MSHIPIILDAIETVESRSAAPPTTAQANLVAALEAADEYTDGSPDPAVQQGIVNLATWIVWYFEHRSPVSENQTQAFADQMNELVPG